MTEWLVKPGQPTKGTVDLKGATKGSPILTLPVARVHIILKYVTRVISTVVTTDPTYYGMLGNRHVYLGGAI